LLVPRGPKTEGIAAVNLVGSYNYSLVALSVLIAMFASYAALDLAERVTAAGGWARAAWLLGGAAAMGTGIWSMHYIGMLAFILPVSVAYHWPTVLLSLLAAILASVVALGVVSRQKMGWFRALAGSVLMGAGIASMHYIGMAAMRLPAICRFNPFLIILSVVFAILISLAALWITFHFRDVKTGIGWEKLAGAVVMGSAIPIMHYTGMAAASFSASDIPPDLSQAVSISALGIVGIAAVTFIVLGLALLTSWVDRRFASQTLEIQEAKLQESEAYLSEAQRLSHTGSFGWKVSADEITWSEETLRIFQYDRATIPTVQLILQRVHPEDASRVKETIERALRDGSDFEHEFRLAMPDGTVKYVHVVAHAKRDASDEIEYVGAVMDITDRKRAEEELRRSEALAEQRLRLVVDTTPAMINTCRPDGYLDYVNKGWLDYFGLSLETALDRADVLKMSPPSKLAVYDGNWQPIIHPQDLSEFTDRWKAMLASGEPGEREARVRRFDGVYRWHLFRAVPLYDETGKLVKWYASAFDIEDRKRAEEALRKAQADLAYVSRVTTMGELTASLAHEIKQPIAAAVTDANTCLRWLTREIPDLEEAREAGSRIVKDVTRAAEIISRIRLLFNKGAVERELIDVNEVIREMIVLLNTEAARHSIFVRTELARDLPQIMGDRVQLQQVIMNLIMNSVDAMKDVNGMHELAIKSQRGENEELLLSVSDTGMGLPPQREQIFNAFFTTKAHGTGMGLAISRSIVESHGGRMWAGDNAPRGARFFLALPTATEARE
jgi:PAS domain S-box-containing protein